MTSSMYIRSDNELSRMLKEDLKNYLIKTGYIGDIPVKKRDLINCIKYKSPLYINHINLYDKILSQPDEKLTGEQKDVYRSIMSFMLGIIEKKKILKTLDAVFIPDISKIIVSKINYMDYPKIRDRLSLLLGGAGTGKTYLVSNIISRLVKLSDGPNNEYPDLYSGMDIQVLAPTNKAIKVIKSKINETLMENKTSTCIINYWTISKFLQQDIEYTPEGRVVYKTKLNIKRSGYDKIKYIIIDEASMISRSNWNDLNRFIFQKLPNVRILLIGDDCQLPPVKEKSSVVFNVRLRRFRLNNIVRTRSKDITTVYNQYRIAVENSVKVDSIETNSDDFKYIKSFKHAIQTEFDVFNDKVISYSNDSVDKYNELVRNIVFDNPEEKYVVSEKLIFGSSVRCANIHGSVSEAKYCFYANDEATVNGVEKRKINTNFVHNEKKFQLESLFPEEIFNVYKLSIQIDNGIAIVYKIVDEEIKRFNLYFEKVYEKMKDLSKNKKINRDYISKLWTIFYTVKNTINVPIKYSYALTVYKAQGSTFQKVFIDLEDIHDCVKYIQVLNKTLYTAVTRASDKIRCYKPTQIEYRYADLEQFPYLKRYNILDHKRVYNVLKDGQPIIYTKNEYQCKNVRKIVRGRVVHILNKIIHIGNSNFTWELKLKDDIIIYI